MSTHTAFDGFLVKIY